MVMPSLESFFCWQTALLFPYLTDDRYGQPVVGGPVEVQVVWVADKREIFNAMGNTVALEAMAVVQQQVAPKSQMWLGALARWVSLNAASRVIDLQEVLTYKETPDVKGRWIRRQVGLVKLHNPPGNS
jgi:hypothetical protein